MNKVKTIFTDIAKKARSLLNSRKRIAIFAIFLVLLGFGGWKLFGKKASQMQYQTAQAEKGTLVVSISASGQVAATNNASVSTQASGVVNKVYVKNDQVVKTGDKIAELELDLDGKLRASQALASYQSAKNNLENARISLYTLQSSLFTNWNTYMDNAQNSTYENADGSPNTDKRQLTQFMITDNDWLAAEAKYKNQQNVVNQSQASVNSAWLSYQQASPIIYAPISGKVTGLSLQEGTVLTAQSNSSGTASSQKIASIKTNAAAQLSVNITEIDVIKIKIGDKATVTLDALSGKTYTGKVISIDTIGSISSGVTNYPAIIGLDSEVAEIFPNMAVNAKIITNVLDDVILVPSGAVQTTNGESTVRILKNGQISQAQVEISGSSDTQVAITSGINEGDTVVTGAVSTTQGSNTQSQSTSSPFGFGGGRNVGGAIRGINTGR